MLFLISLQVSTSIVTFHRSFKCHLSLSFSSRTFTLFIASSLCLSLFFPLSPRPRKPSLLPERVKRSARRRHVVRDPNEPTHMQAHTHTHFYTLCVIHLQISAKECKSTIQKTLHGCQLLAHPNYSIHILSLSLSISMGQTAHYDRT